MPRDDSDDDGYDAPPPRTRRPRDGDDDDRPWSRRRDDGDDGDGWAEPHRGTTVMILGLVALLACGLVGPVAWSMGGTDLKKMRAGTMDPRGEGETKAGYVCGIIATVLLGLTVVIFAFAFVLALGGAAAGN